MDIGTIKPQVAFFLALMYNIFHDFGIVESSTMLIIDGKAYEPRLIIFDKDGTLVDFHYLWGIWSEGYIQAITDALEGGERYRTPLCQALGYDPDARRILHDSPMAIEPADGLVKVAATVLYQQGLPWTKATDIAWQGLRVIREKINLPDLVRPVGDVAGLFRRIRAQGIRIGVATTDERDLTLAAMKLLGAADLVDYYVCGDDGVAIKPAPDMVVKICAALDVPPAETIVVGDTTADMLMGERAGVQLRVGVLTGVGNREDLVAHADVVIESIHDMKVR